MLAEFVRHKFTLDADIDISHSTGAGFHSLECFVVDRQHIITIKSTQQSENLHQA